MIFQTLYGRVLHLYAVICSRLLLLTPSSAFLTVRIDEGASLPSDDRLMEITEVKRASCELEHIGSGLFLTQDVDQGQIVAKFPGAPEWYEVNEDGDLNIPDTEYVFVLGLFVVIDNTGVGTCERYLAWDSLPYVLRGEVGDAKITGSPNKAHFINTYHPRTLTKSYRFYNCVWAVKYDHLVLDVRVKPNAELYVITVKHLPAKEQLLLDYHWYLAYSRGHWCLNKECFHCKDGLEEFMKCLVKV